MAAPKHILRSIEYDIDCLLYFIVYCIYNLELSFCVIVFC